MTAANRIPICQTAKAIGHYPIAELLEKNPNPSEEEIRWGISGNLCRCTGYVNIVKAIQYAAEKMQKEAA